MRASPGRGAGAGEALHCPPGRVSRASQGPGALPGRSPAGTRPPACRRTSPPRMGRKVAALRAGISANCPSANPLANAKRSGGNAREFRRQQQQHHQQLAGQVFALLQRGATGKPGSRHRRGEAPSGRANKTRQGSPETEKRAHLPSPAAAGRTPSDRRDSAPGGGRSPRALSWGRGGGFAGGPRKRKFALLLLPPASATKEPASPHPPRPGLTPLRLPRGTSSRHPPARPAPPPGPLPAGRAGGRHRPRRAPRTRQVWGGRRGRGKGRERRWRGWERGRGGGSFGRRGGVGRGRGRASSRSHAPQNQQ